MGRFVPAPSLGVILPGQLRAQVSLPIVPSGLVPAVAVALPLVLVVVHDVVIPSGPAGGPCASLLVRDVLGDPPIPSCPWVVVPALPGPRGAGRGLRLMVPR
eukprot:8254901-Heterocapsa_arctica.AAC.1